MSAIAECHPLAAIIAVETFVIIEAALAEAWRKGLEAALADVAGLKSYLTEWNGEDPGGGPDVDVHTEGLRYLQAGVAKLEPGSVLLLWIG
jgi:hypothetical protein